ncbi:hypothetical protein BC833DRAFT_287146 [Globomyces pollinis-pini]|nr:hypothetical protein BC833DRAFT_287146 [Globomyces pollinis-pini]
MSIASKALQLLIRRELDISSNYESINNQKLEKLDDSPLLKWSESTQSNKWVDNPKKDYEKSRLIGAKIHNQKIIDIDIAMVEYRNLLDLSFTGNLLSKINQQHLPSHLQILHLNANKITQMPCLYDLKSLVHVGLAYNLIDDCSLLSQQLTHNIQSLDLSWNDLSNFENTVRGLKELKNLRILSLLGNPICLLPQYRHEISKTLNNLIFLDDITTSGFICDASVPRSNEISISIKIHSVENVKNEIVRLPSSLIEQKPADEFFYYFTITLPNYKSIETALFQRIEDKIDMNETYVFQFEPSVLLKNTLVDGFDIQFSVKRFAYHSVTEQPPEEGVKVKIKNPVKGTKRNLK